MAEIDILDAFNDCLDRINSGESLDDCLRDYPQHAQRLRGLLGTGALVHRAQQYPDAEVSADQEHIRPIVITQGRRSLSRELPRRPINWFYWFYPLAGLASVAVVAIVILALIGPAVGNVFSNLVKNCCPINPPPVNFAIATVDETQRTQIAQAIIELSATPPLAMQPVTPTPAALLPTLEPVSGTTLPTVTPRATATMTITTTPTGTPLPTMTLQPGIVTTSVAQMTPLQPSVGDVQLTATALIYLLSPAELTAAPTLSPIILPTNIVGATMLPMTPTAAPTLFLPVQVIPLNAGEIDDNARWDTYLQYRQNYLQQFSSTVHDVNVTGRQIITVIDAQGLPVLGARVVVMVGQTVLSESRTYANGQTLFFPNARPEGSGAQSYRVFVEKDGTQAQFNLDPARGSAWNVLLDQVASPSNPIKLDVLFLLDSTGSMSDEIAQLQNNILGISSQIASMSGNNIDTRYSLVTYRDRGDAYVTLAYDFVSDVGAFQATLSQVQAADGGDGPESLNEGLHNAVQAVAWRGDDTVKLIFLVADAPPHLNYPNDYDYAQEMVVAAGRGIKIHPIASSGLPPDGEFIFRQIAEYTMGHFLFLTYDQGSTSGAPGDSRPDLHVGEPAEPANQQQGDYSVERLDELVLRLITDELAALGTQINRGDGISPTLFASTGLPPEPFVLFPTATFTATPTPLPLPTMPPTLTPIPIVPPTQNSSVLPGNTQIVISLPMFLSIVVVGAVVGYAFNSRKVVTYRKRKNEEIIEPED